MTRSQPRHHILFERTAWSASSQNKAFRNFPELIPPIDQEAHVELHKDIQTVPAPGRYLGQRALASYAGRRRHGDNPFDAIDNVSRAFEVACQHPRANELDIQYAELIIASVRSQLPYIADGYRRDR